MPSSLRPAASLLGLSVLASGAAACGSDGRGLVGETLGTSSAAISPIPGCDYSFARPSPSSLVSMGYTFAARYLSGDPSSGKDLSASEATDLTGAGLDIVLVWETSGTDATDGYNQGVSDATAAASEASTVGAPATRPIYFAIDFDASSSDASSINAYFQGVASVLGLSRTGVYGGYYIVDELFNAGLITFAWQTYAWSDGNWDARAQLRQTQNGVDNDELDADEGVVADFGQWGPGFAGTSDYAATFVSQSFPLAVTALPMVEGQTIPSYIELKNTGRKAWDSNTRLGTTQPRDRASVFADSSWISSSRPAGVTGTVPPGGTYKFMFDLHAPEKAGTYLEYFGVLEEGDVWFSDPSQGGPADNDLEVQVVVTAPLDGGPSYTDAGSQTDASSVDAATPDDARAGRLPGRGQDSGATTGGGNPPTHDHDARAPDHAGEDAGVGDADVVGSPALSGGCSLAKSSSTSSIPYALLGLVVAVRRRRRARLSLRRES